jgi:hypothetical protein
MLMKHSLTILFAALLFHPGESMSQLPAPGGKANEGAEDSKKEAEKPARSEQELERIQARNRRKAQEAWARDQKKRNAKDYAEMEAEYQEINKNYKAPNVMGLLEAFIKKWKNGNRVGCATLYLAQKTGGPEREKLLEKCVKDFSDAYYLDGCSVGGLSRLYLASWYQQNGKASAAKKLVEEIEKTYAEAEDHSGRLIVDQLGELKKK